MRNDPEARRPALLHTIALLREHEETRAPEVKYGTPVMHFEAGFFYCPPFRIRI